ncbi:helix-turn-helix domain-containing protein [Brenneria uluponensis]|uniref:helix-turn-helix domain-containing protein n=1 Tax=Brenneria uluponensis TaxID=3057057 RepID=UPI0028ECA82B|nr:helix-turn-helix domain-containing protein [Brenneria ulupoensis]
MNINEKIAARLKEARERKGISQKVLADWCGWAQSRIGNYETGSRSIGADDAMVLASVLDITPSELMFGDNGDPSQWMGDREQKMLELFRQLPEAEQNRMIDLFQLRLKELDEYVDKYLRGRYKPVDE